MPAVSRSGEGAKHEIGVRANRGATSHSSAPPAVLASAGPPDTASERGFPVTLLESPTEERVRYFRQKFIQHTKHKEVSRQVLRAIRYSSKAQIIMIYGPSGVGKTTLCDFLLKRLLQEAFSEMEADPGMVPAISLEIAPSALGRFDWSGLYEGLLRAAVEPEALIARKQDAALATSSGRWDGRERGTAPLAVGRGGPLRTLRHAVEACFRNRKVRVALLDEAHHLKLFAKGARSMLEQMDNIKSLANTTSTTFALLGTYELLPLTELSDQLCRRSVRVHFPRYNWHDAEDRRSFKNALGTFQMCLPLREEPDLTSDLPYFYRGCLGCVGTLKEWLDRALAAALEDAERKPFSDYLDECVLSPGDLLTMASRVKEGEEFVASKESAAADLSAVLGLGEGRTGADAPVRARVEDEAIAPSGGAPKRRQPRRAGERNPTRDRVGA